MWARRTKSLDALLPVLYLRGISTGDFQEALAALLGKDAPNLSAVISRLTAEWQGEYGHWQKRDLSARRYLYVWADGVFLQARMEDLRKGNDGRPSPLTVLKGYCDCAQLLSLALRHAMDDVRRKSVPDIVGNTATRRPGDQLALLWQTKLLAARSSPRPVPVRSMATPFHYRFPVRRPLPRHSTIEQVLDLHRANGFVRRHSYFPSD